MAPFSSMHFPVCEAVRFSLLGVQHFLLGMSIKQVLGTHPGFVDDEVIRKIVLANRVIS